MGGRPAGFKTEATRAEYIRWYAEAVACSSTPVDDANHIIVIDQPDVVDAHLRQFLGTP
jgi:hypothetical protein